MLPLLHTKLVAKLCVAAVLPFVAAVYSIPDRPVSSLQDGFAVVIPSHETTYRLAGEFTRSGRPVNAPLVKKGHGGLIVMKTQVSAGDYDRCVREGACRATDGRAGRSPDRPIVGVSWEDAIAYARWFSGRNGQEWRLPTDEEWAFFAAERFNDDAVRAGGDGFSERWLAKYESEASRDLAVERTVQPIGTFGMNTLGLADVAGTVWEWTDTCFTRQRIGTDGMAPDKPIENCGVRVVEGRHRAYVTNFVRDARAGGCAVGVPPANLGFRLVRSIEAKPH